MIINIKNVDINISTQPIETIQADVMVHWVLPGLESGPPEFNKIHREASPDMYQATILFNDILKDGDCFSTHAGMLPVKLAIHALIPGNSSLYKQTFFNISKTIAAYKEKNLVNTISIYFHDNLKSNIDYMMEFIIPLGIKQIYIAAREDQLNTISKIVKSHKKSKSIFQILDKLFMNSMIWLGNIFNKNNKNPN